MIETGKHMIEAGILIVVCAVIAFSFLYPKWRDQNILRAPLPQHWQEIISRRIPFLNKLSAAEKIQLLDMIKLFLAKKKFHGCGGLIVNDEIRVTIAAEACLLLLNRGTGVYSALHHILVYPDAFNADSIQHHSDGTVTKGKVGVLGQSWSNGKIILSWDDVEYGVDNFHDGHNVLLHEFSHQLDSESGSTNGAPRLKKNSYKIWSKVLSEEFETLVEARDGHSKSVMDYYGATNPAEFFAVVTETFFEKPDQLFKKHPELFEQFKTFYHVDPRAWQ